MEQFVYLALDVTLLRGARGVFFLIYEDYLLLRIEYQIKEQRMLNKKTKKAISIQLLVFCGNELKCSSIEQNDFL
jgi:hypothetical protein